MNKRNTILTLLFSTLLFLMPLQASESNQKPTIAASTFSLYDIAKNIAKDSAEVFMIMPFGVDAHSYEPSPKQMVKISKSSLVLYSGAGLEPWIEGFEFKNRAVDISTFVNLKELSQDHKHAHKHATHGVDPHYWQDLQNMILATNQITKELISLFPKNEEMYVKNRDIYVLMLQDLDATYRVKLSECKLDTIIVNHNAFSYLAHRYNFHTEALSGLSPEAEPNAKDMIKLIKFIKEHRVKVIFFEKFASQKAIKSIAKESGVAADALQPLGNITADEAKKNLGYEDIMRVNLQKISSALECK